jgi:hypothetical protein
VGKKGDTAGSAPLHYTTAEREREREREFGLFFMARRKSPIDERPNIRKEF